MYDLLLALYEGIYWRGHTEDEDILPRKQARKRNGVVKTRFFGMPKLLIQHRECNVTVYSVKNRETRAVVREIRSPGNKLAVLRREDDHDSLKKTKDSAVTTGNPKFDESFIVLTKHEQFAKHILSLDTQHVLLNMRKHWKSTFQITPKGVIFKVKPQLTDEMEYDSFIEAILSLTDSLKNASLITNHGLVTCQR